MTRKAREIETLLLTMFAAVPLYVTTVIAPLPLILFHTILAGMVLRVAAGKGPQLIPPSVMRVLAIAYIPFYVVDAWMISGSAIAASTHLVLFIAVYQPIEASLRNNQAQRLLTTSLIFVASLATSTHITIVLFVIAYALLMFRQLMYLSHMDTVRSMGGRYDEPPSARAAVFYLAGTAVIAALLFPLLPRVRSPFMHGITGSLPGAASALSDTIDFRERRVTPPDSTLVARVWMNLEALPFFTPLRLKGAIYDRYVDGEWKQTALPPKERRAISTTGLIAQPRGVASEAVIHQRPQRGRLFLPVGTYRVSDLESRIYEGPAADTFYTRAPGMTNVKVQMAYDTMPLVEREVSVIDYPVRLEIAALAQSIVGDELRPERRAARIESYLSRNYRYVPNTVEMERLPTVEDFLLRDREGNCEYFAAGMTVLMTALDVPARIAGGYYGGRRNPLTGYYAITRDDAHAWTEVWDGTKWRTFDATPPSLRPGIPMGSLLREYVAALTDSLTFIWDRYVLTFGLADQVAMLAEGIDWMRSSAASLRGRLAADARAVVSPPFLTVAALLIAAGFALIMLSRRRRSLFHALAAHLARHGIDVGPAMTLEEALERLRAEHPDRAQEIEPLVTLYEAERFSPVSDRQRAARIRRRLAELQA
jgi:protein-glutamine gamma-glutamyltransferase